MSSKNSKIEEIYKNLSKLDIDNITTFLGCSIFNQSDIVIGIHLYLSSTVSRGKGVNKMELYHTVFSKKEKYSDLKLRVFFTKLVKLIEKYLIVKNIDTYPLAELTILNQYYSKNHLHKNYTVFFNSKAEQKFDSYEEKLLYDYVFSMRKADYVNQEFPNDNEMIQNHMEQILINQRKLNFFQTLRTQCDFMSITQKYRIERDMSYEETILGNLVEKKEEQDDVFKAYILVYLLSKEAKEEYFLDLKMIIIHERIQYESNHRAIIRYAQNICIKLINSGKSEFLHHLFDINNINLKYYKIAGDLSTASFRNTMYCALQLGKIEWAENFVANYHQKVNESEQENTYNFNYARIYFEKGEYKSAMRQLLKVTYEDSFYAITARILLIKCYYELNDEMPLISCCESLTQFLNRNKEFTPQRIENNLHFIKYVKMLQKHRLQKDKRYFSKLHERVNESTVVEKEWLLKKINSLST